MTYWHGVRGGLGLQISVGPVVLKAPRENCLLVKGPGRMKSWRLKRKSWEVTGKVFRAYIYLLHPSFVATLCPALTELWRHVVNPTALSIY